MNVTPAVPSDHLSDGVNRFSGTHFLDDFPDTVSLLGENNCEDGSSGSSGGDALFQIDLFDGDVVLVIDNMGLSNGDGPDHIVNITLGGTDS